MVDNSFGFGMALGAMETANRIRSEAVQRSLQEADNALWQLGAQERYVEELKREAYLQDCLAIAQSENATLVKALQDFEAYTKSLEAEIGRLKGANIELQAVDKASTHCLGLLIEQARKLDADSYEACFAEYLDAPEGEKNKLSKIWEGMYQQEAQTLLAGSCRSEEEEEAGTAGAGL